jgi:hypothetical protein
MAPLNPFPPSVAWVQHASMQREKREGSRVTHSEGCAHATCITASRCTSFGDLTHVDQVSLGNCVTSNQYRYSSTTQCLLTKYFNLKITIKQIENKNLFCLISFVCVNAFTHAFWLKDALVSAALLHLLIRLLWRYKLGYINK